MKNFKHLLAVCLLFFIATTAMAQTQSDNTELSAETITRADVNSDGVVNEADIAEIITIMQNAGGVAEQTKYYWYVGQTNPASIDESNLKTATNEAGWHLIGTSTDGFTMTFNNSNLIEFDEKKPYYLIIPNSLNVYAADGNTPLEDKSLLATTCSIENHKAFVYYTSVYEVKGVIIK